MAFGSCLTCLLNQNRALLASSAVPSGAGTSEVEMLVSLGFAVKVSESCSELFRRSTVDMVTNEMVDQSIETGSCSYSLLDMK